MERGKGKGSRIMAYLRPSLLIAPSGSFLLWIEALQQSILCSSHSIDGL